MFLTFIDQYIEQSKDLNDSNLVFWIRCLNKAIPHILSNSKMMEELFETKLLEMSEHQIISLNSMYEYLNEKKKIELPSFYSLYGFDNKYEIGGLGLPDSFLEKRNIIIHGSCFYAE